MSAREAILGRVRSALGRPAGTPLTPIPPVRLRVPSPTVEEKIASFRAAVELLAGKTFLAGSHDEVRTYVQSVIGNGTYATSRSKLLAACGLQAAVSTEQNRDTSATVDFGVTGAQYALADTGSLVVWSHAEESRLLSLLPPVHIAVISRDQILSGLDELFTMIPRPADHTSSMVFITGPSRTADIEQILIRGVHGPRELHVVIV